jgi:hypothetical protein
MDISGPVDIFLNGWATLHRLGNATVRLHIRHSSKHRYEKCVAHFKLGVIFFGPIRFLLIKTNQTDLKKKPNPKPNQNQVKPTGFYLVFNVKNQENLYSFLGFL